MPSFTSGRAILGVRQRHAEVTAEGELEATAHAGAADGGDDGLVGGLHDLDDGVEIGLGEGLGAAEFLDVGAARERTLGPDQDHGLHLGVGTGGLDPSHDLRAQGVAQAVDGGVVERDDGHAASQLIGRLHALSSGLPKTALGDLGALAPKPNVRSIFAKCWPGESGHATRAAGHPARG
ncbi:MAG: hypothetical protein QM778_26915 [Myxococcales bacterium]